MQRLLNKDDKRKREMFRIIENSVPVNYMITYNPITVKIVPLIIIIIIMIENL